MEVKKKFANISSLAYNIARNSYCFDGWYTFGRRHGHAGEY